MSFIFYIPLIIRTVESAGPPGRRKIVGEGSSSSSDSDSDDDAAANRRARIRAKMKAKEAAEDAEKAKAVQAVKECSRLEGKAAVKPSVSAQSSSSSSSSSEEESSSSDEESSSEEEDLAAAAPMIKFVPKSKRATIEAAEKAFAEEEEAEKRKVKEKQARALETQLAVTEELRKEKEGNTADVSEDQKDLAGIPEVDGDDQGFPDVGSEGYRLWEEREIERLVEEVSFVEALPPLLMPPPQ